MNELNKNIINNNNNINDCISKNLNNSNYKSNDDLFEYSKCVLLTNNNKKKH